MGMRKCPPQGCFEDEVKSASGTKPSPGDKSNRSPPSSQGSIRAVASKPRPLVSHAASTFPNLPERSTGSRPLPGSREPGSSSGLGVWREALPPAHPAPHCPTPGSRLAPGRARLRSCSPETRGLHRGGWAEHEPHARPVGAQEACPAVPWAVPGPVGRLLPVPADRNGARRPLWPAMLGLGEEQLV